ncbi:MAG: TM2 domain-containing protein [Ruminococcus sp.]|nr:TM2 domain-containing protein [Ruminococcus sp.]
MYCKNCGNPVEPGAASCMTCGAYVGQGNNYCGNCGNPVQPGAAVCMNCGFALNGARTIAPPGAKSKMAAGLLGIFLGSLGVHNFYLGYTGKAVTQLCLTLAAFLLTPCTFGISAIIYLGPWIWSLIEGIMILTGSINTDADGKPLGD